LSSNRSLDSLDPDTALEVDACIPVQIRDARRDPGSDDSREGYVSRFDQRYLKTESDRGRRDLGADETAANDCEPLSRLQQRTQSQRIIEIADKMYAAIASIPREQASPRAGGDNDGISLQSISRLQQNLALVGDKLRRRSSEVQIDPGLIVVLAIVEVDACRLVLQRSFGQRRAIVRQMGLGIDQRNAA
jgi:hypothetical protein